MKVKEGAKWHDVEEEAEAGSEGAAGDIEEELASASKVATAIDLTEIVEPIRMAEDGQKKPPALIAFKNPLTRPVILQIPHKVAIPPGKACQFPLGYHRAIHRRAPALICEKGAACDIPIHLGQAPQRDEVS